MLRPPALLVAPLLIPMVVGGCRSRPIPSPEAAANPSTPGAASASASVPSYAEARARFHTRLIRKGPSPQEYEPTGALPASARTISYRSGELTLTAWVSVPPGDGGRHAAVLFLHGGFAFDPFDWDQAKPYRDAGYVVMVPILRGENGQPGDYSLFFDEVDDVLGAADALVALPYVRSDRVFVAGHSAGGTLAMLAAMGSGRFRAAAAFAGSPDQVAWLAQQPEFAPFDVKDAEELRMRSPLAFAGSFRCPVRLYHGEQERFFYASTAKLVEGARLAGGDVERVVVPGDHLGHVGAAMERSIEFFRGRE